MPVNPKPPIVDAWGITSGERPCQACGLDEYSHRGTWDEPLPLKHRYTFPLLKRLVARVANAIWATTWSMYVLGRIPRP